MASVLGMIRMGKTPSPAEHAGAHTQLVQAAVYDTRQLPARYLRADTREEFKQPGPILGAQTPEYLVLSVCNHGGQPVSSSMPFHRRGNQNSTAVARITFSTHQPPGFECPDSVGDVTGVEHGGLAELGLTQCAFRGQRRQAAVLVATHPGQCEVLVQGLMRACRGRTQNPCRE